MRNSLISTKVVGIQNYREYSTKVDEMATKELIHNIKITLPLIALCLPLSAKYYAIAENGCPYETYIRIEGKCIDISAEGLQNITKEPRFNGKQVVIKEFVQGQERYRVEPLLASGFNISSSNATPI